MRYKIKAHPTDYAGVHFRSRLEARWAAFFNCMQWKWAYEPIDLEGWTPDFSVALPLGIIGTRTVLVEVKPYTKVAMFKNHQCMKYVGRHDIGMFGLDPTVSEVFVLDRGLITLKEQFQVDTAWLAAGNLTQWRKKK